MGDRTGRLGLDLLAKEGPTLGDNWKGWHDENIPVAETRYEAYLRDLVAEEG